MKFICDVCPRTAHEGHSAVIIGNYEQWIRHLLSPQHQTEQNLVMARTSYWPKAEWSAMVKDLPAFREDTAELFVDLMMNLSEYGFIEAIYYGSRTKDSLCAALQLYETNVCPSHLMYRDGMKFDLRIAPRSPMDGKNAGKMGRRRQRYGSIASTVSEGSVVSTVDAATNTIEDKWIPGPQGQGVDVVDSLAKRVGAEVIIDQGEQQKSCEKKTRIKYNRETLLEFYGERSLPSRLHDVLILREIVLKEPKFIDPDQIRQPNVQWCVDTNRNFPSSRTNINNFRPPNLHHNQNGQRSENGNGRGQYQRYPYPRNQNGWNSQKPENKNGWNAQNLENKNGWNAQNPENKNGWVKDQEQVQVNLIEVKEEEWW